MHVGKLRLRDVWIIPVVLLGMVVALASVPPVARSAAPDAENLKGFTPILEAKLKDWLSAWRVVRPSFDIGLFAKYRTSPGPLIKGPWKTVDLNALLSDPLGIFLFFSQDRRWIVDPFGGVGLYKDAKDDPNFSLNAGPDTAVLLIDRKKSLMREILGCGTTCGFHEAAWISNDIFFVSGYYRLEKPRQGCGTNYTFDPTLYSFDLLRNFAIAYGYRGPESCNGIGPEYIVEKIRKKIPNIKD